MELEEPKTNIVCADCGRVINENEEYYTTIYEKVICQGCYEDHYFTCDRCGGIEHLNDEYAVYSEDNNGYNQKQYWCRTCMEDCSFYCNCCDERYDMDTEESFITEHGDTICQGCRDESYYTCDNCGELVYCDNMYYLDDNDDEGYCRSCYNELRNEQVFERVMGYHSQPPMTYYQSADEEPIHPFKGFGIELEVDEGNIDRNDMAQELHQIVGNHLYYNSDGSLGSNGFEIISLPHTEKALYEIEWEEVLRKLIGNGFTSHNNGNCGLHMHISRAFFGDNEQERTDNIAKMVMFYELFWEDIRRFSRRTNSQVRDWANRYCGDTIPTEQHCKNIACSRSNGRYRAVNLNNYDTVEFRIMRGSLKYQTFMATLDFLITTAKNSKYIDWASINDKDQWLNGIKDDTIEYMKIRKCFGYTNNQNQETNGDDEDDELL